ncbi:MAG: Rrf2 family transcriptional regulator [Christensenellaceae bacterium]|nr:Rrf2 family transcriptional regulator [Christensenellaceae bacterium]
MIISTKGRYGVRAMFVLAEKYEEGPQSIKSIAENQHISETYLEQLFATLRKSGLITSTRGAGGGYILAKKPDEITVGSILEALEGPLTPADCVTGNCDSAHDCATHSIWLRIYKGISGVVNSITLQDMLNDYNDNSSLDLSRCK